MLNVEHPSIKDTIFIPTAGAKVNCGGNVKVTVGGTEDNTLPNETQFCSKTLHTNISYGGVNPVIDDISIEFIFLLEVKLCIIHEFKIVKILKLFFICSTYNARYFIINYQINNNIGVIKINITT